MHRRVLSMLLVGLSSFLALGAAPPAAAPEGTLTVAKYLDYETVANPRISPDGSQIVYTRRFVNKLEDKQESALWIMGADGSRHRFLTKGANAVWSPDGKRIAYIAEGEPKGPQVFVKWVDVEGTTQITRVEQPPADLRWSPDGTQVGFSMFVPKPAKWDIEMPKPPEGAKWTKAPAIVERLHYRQDQRGYTEPGFVHLFLVPADGGTPRALTSGDWSVGARFDALAGAVEWDWSPAGKTIVVAGLDEADADLRYRDADLLAIDVASGARRKLTTQRGNWSAPKISPDGRLVAFTGYPATRASYQAEDLYVMGLDGSGQRKISGDFDRDPQELHWAADGRAVYFGAGDHGTSNVHVASLEGGVKSVSSGTHMLSLAGVSKGGVAVGVRSSFQQPPDVVRFSLQRAGEILQLTHVNDDLLAGVKLGAVEELNYGSSGGARIQGWLVKPPSFDPEKRYPMIMEIHGGPHGMYNVGFSYMFQTFAANGYVVLYTNPRGSTGYGSAFGNAIARAYPGVDYDDLMAGVDAATKRGYVDERNMFVGGCSGGGVLSSWVIGHTNRFAAAAVRCPVIDWLSFAGHTDIPYFTHSFFDKPFWEDPGPWLKQSSLMYVGNVKTPTLLMTGVLDLRTPMPQTEEYYAALKMRGVPTKLLRFEGEYHGTTSKPSNFLRTVLYMLSWYKEHGHWDEAVAAASR